jgi:hypothetical protein
MEQSDFILRQMAVHELKVQLSPFRLWGRKVENQIKIT